MDWPAAERLLNVLDEEDRARLLRLLEAPDDVRARMIGRIHARKGGGDMEEFLILLEEKEWRGNGSWSGFD